MSGGASSKTEKNLEVIKDVLLLPSQQAAVRATHEANCRQTEHAIQMLKEGHLKGVPVVVGLGGDNSTSPDFEINHLRLLRAAHLLFLTHSLRPEFNAAAKPLIEDMRAHPEEWAAFYSEPANEAWCERSVGVVNTYATWLRQRSAELQDSGPSQEVAFRAMLSECESVLNMGGRQLRLYKDHVETARPHRDTVAHALGVKCLKGLTFKYLLIKHNVLRQTGRLSSVNPSEIRFLCQYEFEFYPDISAESNDTDFADNLLMALGLPVTRAALDGVSSKQIRFAYKVLLPEMMRRFCPDVPFQREATGFRHMCGGCGSFEDSSKDYLRCGRCLTERYCSQVCQLASWKDHKPVCSARAK